MPRRDFMAVTKRPFNPLIFHWKKVFDITKTPFRDVLPAHYKPKKESKPNASA